jgi:hypothetical protein
MGNPYDPIPLVDEDQDISASKTNDLIRLCNRNRIIPDEQTLHGEFTEGGCLLSVIESGKEFHGRTTSAYLAAADDDHMASGTVMLRTADPSTGILADTGISVKAWSKDTSATGAIASGTKVIVRMIEACWTIVWVQC